MPGTPARRTLTVRSSSKVYIDGVDILAEIDWLTQMVHQLEATTALTTAIPTTTAPTTATPTTTAPTTAVPTTATPTTAAPTTVAPSAAPTFLVDCRGSATITSDASLAQQLGGLRRCGTFSGGVTIYGGSAWPGLGVTNSTLYGLSLAPALP